MKTETGEPLWDQIQKTMTSSELRVDADLKLLQNSDSWWDFADACDKQEMTQLLLDLVARIHQEDPSIAVERDLLELIQARRLQGSRPSEDRTVRRIWTKCKERLEKQAEHRFLDYTEELELDDDLEVVMNQMHTGRLSRRFRDEILIDTCRLAVRSIYHYEDLKDHLRNDFICNEEDRIVAFVQLLKDRPEWVWDYFFDLSSRGFEKNDTQVIEEFKRIFIKVADRCYEKNDLEALEALLKVLCLPDHPLREQRSLCIQLKNYVRKLTDPKPRTGILTA